MKVILYSIGCQKCKILETLFAKKNIEFELVNDEEKTVEVGRAHNILGAPILQVDDEFFDYNGAIKWMNERSRK